MRGNWMPFLSGLGVPLLGLGVLVFCLGRPQISMRVEATDQSMILLLDPDPKLDKALSVYLCQQAKYVACCRQQARPDRLVQAISDYNLVARECTPTVFQATRLPHFLEQ